MTWRIAIFAVSAAWLAACSAPPIEWADLSPRHPANPSAEAAPEDMPPSLFGRKTVPETPAQPAKPRAAISPADHSGHPGSSK